MSAAGPTVDVVVVNYRSGERLASCLAAARSFLGPDARLVVVDNSVGDGSVAAARQRHPDLLAIENEKNIGFAAAVNRGLANGQSELVLLLNPDVPEIRGDPGSIYAAFAGDDRVAAVGPRLLNEDGSIQRSARREPGFVDLLSAALGRRLGDRERQFYLDEWDYSTSRVVDWVFGACLFVRRGALVDVGAFDERFFVYSEEMDWMLRAKRLGWKTLLLPEVEALHGSRSSSSAGEEALSLLLAESVYVYVDKHLDRGRRAAFRSILLAVDGVRWLVAALRGRSKREHRLALQRRLALHAGGTIDHPR